MITQDINHHDRQILIKNINIGENMIAYNINNVAMIMNEDVAAKYNKETEKFEKSEQPLMEGGHVAPNLNRTNAQPTRFTKGPGGKTTKTMGSGKGKKEGKKEGKNENPFAKGGSVEESIDRLLYLLEALDQEGLSAEEQDEILKRANTLPPKYVRSATPGPKLAATLASSARVKAHVDKSKAARLAAKTPRSEAEGGTMAR